MNAVVSTVAWLFAFEEEEDQPRKKVLLLTPDSPPRHRPIGWRWVHAPEPPSPEFILFYSGSAIFPNSALIFSGAAGPSAWATTHRQPIVLDHLQRRFISLMAGTTDRPASSAPGRMEIQTATASIREQHQSGDGLAETTPPPQRITATALYHQVLQAHFAGSAPTDESSRSPTAPTLAAHQERAYERARDILKRYGGVIVADAVGLGKTFIGVRLVERAIEQGARVLMVVPAALRAQWRRELAYLGMQPESAAPNARPVPEGRTRSDNLELWVRERWAEPIRVVSMESLGRRTFECSGLRGAGLVVVDEAHNFRNPATRRYRRLADLARASQVVLLTATPINNSILDLQHLIDLFAAPGAFRHLGVPDYRDAFQLAQLGSADVRAIVSACVLRRTRRFLREHYGEVRVRDAKTGRTRELRFPNRRPPVPVEYDLAGTYGELFAELDEWMDGLQLPHLAPSTYTQSESPASPGALLKLILLKRLESSIEAFRSSVTQQVAWCDTALQALSAGRILTRPDYRSIFRGPADDPGSQLAFVELLLPAEPATARHRITEFRRLLSQDRKLLARIHNALTRIGPRDDHKLLKLLQLIDGPLANRKVLVFTEFRDTARYIHRQLGHRPYLAQIDSGQARLGRQLASRREVIERFAPRSNGLPNPPEHERVDLLIATDVLSEGLNLQDASAVLSYDLPWNPVRLMQRMGRIDRLGAVADWVELFHFVPVDQLERLLGLMERLQRKVSAITEIIGIDHPILVTPEAAITSPSERIRQLAREPKSFESVEQELEGSMDPEERAYLDYAAALEGGNVRARENEMELSRPPGPLAAAALAVEGETARAIAYWQIRRGTQRRALWLVCDLDSFSVIEDQAEALMGFTEARKRPERSIPRPLLDSVRDAFRRYVEAATDHLEATQIAGDAISPSLPQCRIAASLSRYLQATGPRLPAEERVRIDDLLTRLSRRFTKAAEHVLSELLDELPQRPDPDFLEHLAGPLRTLQSETRTDIAVREVGTLLLPAGK